MESVYDEFGNYIGPDLGDDSEYESEEEIEADEWKDLEGKRKSN